MKCAGNTADDDYGKNEGTGSYRCAHRAQPVTDHTECALQAAGIDCVYAALPVRPGALSSAVYGLRDAGVVGLM